MLDLIANVGSQLGRVAERKRSESELQRAKEAAIWPAWRAETSLFWVARPGATQDQLAVNAVRDCVLEAWEILPR